MIMVGSRCWQSIVTWNSAARRVVESTRRIPSDRLGMKAATVEDRRGMKLLSLTRRRCDEMILITT
jgi:hypothetical protein